MADEPTPRNDDLWGCLTALGTIGIFVALCIAALAGLVWVVSWAWHQGAMP